MQNMNSNELSLLSPKVLKEYIRAYNLPAKSAIEKDDLVRIIFNTRPISNENEKYYRRHKRKSAAASNNEDNNGGSFSLSNMVQDLFTPPQPTSNHKQQQQQRQQEAARRQQQAQQEAARRQQQAQQEAARRLQQQQREEHDKRHQQQHQEHIARMRQQQQRTATPPSSTTNNSSRPSPRPSPPLSNENLLSLHDLVKAKIDPASLSVRTLKSILKANYVEQSHVIEKSELVKLVIRLADQHRAEMEGSQSGGGDSPGSGGTNEDLLCRICFDHQQNCVFLDCGHMVTCMECAKKLIETKNECPICREPILKLVHVFRS